MRVKYILPALALLAMPALTVHASSCAPASLEQAFEDAALIFSGEVTAIDYHTPRKPVFEENDRYNKCGSKTVTFKVKANWKGAAENAYEIFAADGCMYLGGYFDKGESYLVYAYDSASSMKWKGRNKDVKYDTSVCGRTKSLGNSGALEELIFLETKRFGD